MVLLRADVRRCPGLGAGARALVERLALALQAATLLRADSPLAEAFCRSRLGGGRGMVFGTLNADAGIEIALDRAWSG